MGTKHCHEEDARLGRVQSLVRAFGILDQLCQTDGLTLNEVSQLARLPRSTSHRLLTTMEALHYARYDRGTGRWCVGHKASGFGGEWAMPLPNGQPDHRASE